jgi:IS30 family transposase
LTPPERAAVAARFAAGASVREVMAVFGVSATTARRIGDEAALARGRVGHSPRRLSFAEREEIFAGICRDESDSESGRPQSTKLAGCPRLLAAVEAGLGRRWSPQQISARLRREYPCDPQMRISHETIYRSLYVQARGELRRQLTAKLRTGRQTRRSRGRVETRGRIVDMVPIAQRPPEADDRRVPGHWEGDLLVGKHGRSFVATLVERQTRYLLLARLGGDRSSEHVTDALTIRIADLPAHLLRSLTWDQGKELSAHSRLSQATGIEIFFCDPHSPWQRGSNENTNGLLRQYLPKGTDLAIQSQADLDAIAAELNGRPRETLAWMTPAERMAELLR